jgi:hypothetical protein
MTPALIHLAASWLETRWRIIHEPLSLSDTEGALLGLMDCAREMKRVLEESR